jgi:hypothetical protein
MVALGERVAVEWAFAMACSMARRMHPWSYSGSAMLVPCHVCGVLLPLDEKIMSFGCSELSGMCGSAGIC